MCSPTRVASGCVRSLRRAVSLLPLAGVLAGCGTTAAAPAARARPPRSPSGLIGYPSFLPSGTPGVGNDAPLVGTVRRPALTSEGDTVTVVTPHWSVRAVVTGPEVPGEGLPYQQPVTTCTWTVTLSDVTGAAPVSVADFDTIDQQGAVSRPYLVPGRPVPPAALEPGQTTTFQLRVSEPVGEGLIRWAPVAGHIVAKWDFIVEND